MDPLLPAIILTPIVGAVAILLLFRNDPKRGPLAACAVAALTLVLSISLASKVSKAPLPTGENGPVSPRVSFSPDWLSIDLPIITGGKKVHWPLWLGVDGPGLAMVLLTSLVTLSTLLVSSRLIDHRATDYAAMILLTSAGMLGVFLSMDLLLFYIFFELTLIPLLVLITVWGEKGTAWPAARKFLLYTLAGSIPMVVGFAGIVFAVTDSAGIDATVSIPAIAKAVAHQHVEFNHAAGAVSDKLLSAESTQCWFFGLIFLGFGIKMALLPFHSWLPTTYSSSHPTTTAILAAVVLKLGIFGFLRVALPLLPLAVEDYAIPLIGSLGAAAVVFGALVALAQRDLRLLLAYSSLSHVGFITLGLFSLTVEGASGATLQMVNHGLTTAALFLLAAVLIDRRRSSDLESAPLGLASIYPRLAVLFVFFTLAGTGVPGLNNFVGEVLAISGMLSRSPILAVVAATGIVLGAWYALRLVQRLLFGKPNLGVLAGYRGADLGLRELSSLLPIAGICLAIGVAPNWAMNVIEPDVKALVAQFEPVPGGNAENIASLADRLTVVEDHQ